MTETYRRGDDGYEAARQSAVWNDRKPDRFPDVIVVAETEQDVVDAVVSARERGLRVKVRSGGHSWTASGVRDGGMLIDMSRLREITYDPRSRTATAQPGAYGGDLLKALEPHGRFFPSGHCPTVGLGGYLLQGGLGWQSRLLGPACASVLAVDVLTADGEIIHADEHENSDLYWAARGSGPGFFGIVMRFHLRTHPRPPVTMASVQVFPLEVYQEVLTWAIETGPDLDPRVEILFVATNPRLEDGSTAPGPTAIQIIACAMADTEAEARDILSALDTNPVCDTAVTRTTFPATMDQMYAAVDALEPSGHRWLADNMWTDAGADVLVPQLRELFTTVPNDISHVLWYPWRDHPIDAAFSNTGRSYIAAYAGWDDPAQDDAYVGWVTGQMRRLEPLSKGIQLGDENLVNRPWRYLAEDNERRLEELREQYDPDGRFFGYLGL
ncbi:FAD-binding oxidoreductase [Streptomyces solisilvae]|uniref:FAD-binding oxidoreductase n=1 Tax=Streptomyces malaysiensis TaxID=92644 RepID=UPI00332FC7DF